MLASTPPNEWTPHLDASTTFTDEAQPGVFTFWDGALLHHGAIQMAGNAERLQLHNLIRAPLRAKELANWNVLPGSQAVGRHMNLQDYWVAAPSVRENLPEGYVREAYDRWYAQLGELPPELEGRGIDPTEQFDYAEAALCLLR